MRTKRLILRELDARDASPIAELAGDWDVARMTSRIPFPYSETLAHQWMRGIESGEYVWGIVLDGTLIGAVGYMPQADGAAEMGYWIGKPWWGQGYATEAARAVVQHCFRTARINRLVCCHFVDNHASKRVIAKLGFRLVGPGTAWCEARAAEVPTMRYERRRPVLARLWRPAA